MKRLVILGSTGSIGRQTLEVVDMFPHEYKVVGLSTFRNTETLLKQVSKFQPRLICIGDSKCASKISKEIKKKGVQILVGEEGALRLAKMEEADIVVSAMVGAVGLKPTITALQHKKTVALANKEVLVMGGELIAELSRKYKTKIIPIDSEHSTIFQILERYGREGIKRIILTASGGPFHGKNKIPLFQVTPKQALLHPKWNMGKKVSIDSATLMNKGLEVIEARWLFGISEKIIEILIHPQSLVHSMVEYIDGSIIAHIGKADMRIPIAYALSYPKRHALNIPSLNLIEERFNFEKPDSKRFPCYLLAYKALEIGGTAPAVLNAANEEAVNAFLKLTLSFEEIYKVITHVLKIHKPKQAKTLTNIFEADKWARKEAKKFIGAKDEKKNPQR